MLREERCVKLGKVLLHGDTRDCLRSHSIEKKESRWIKLKSS